LSETAKNPGLPTPPTPFVLNPFSGLALGGPEPEDSNLHELFAHKALNIVKG
jgi:hypothetical protein